MAPGPGATKNPYEGHIQNTTGILCITRIQFHIDSTK
jgi:hypothetical protein